jgi:hypothetical protein
MKSSSSLFSDRPARKARVERRLHAGHFAFMRAVVQGLDLRESWERYVPLEGEATDLRRVRSTIAWIRSEFAAAARRHAKPGTARLVVMDAGKVADAKLPSLEEFAAAVGLTDFSEAEQLDPYQAAFPEGGSKGSRRARLIRRQLQALRLSSAKMPSNAALRPSVGSGPNAVAR